MNKKIIFFVIIISIALISISAVVANKQTDLRSIGDKLKSIKMSSDANDIVMLINDMPISKKQLETYKMLSKEKGLSDDEIINQYIFEKLLYQQSIKEGNTVSDAEVDNYISENKRTTKENPEGEKLFRDYLEGAGLTEEEYWIEMRVSLKELMITAKLKKKLKDEYLKDKGVKVNAADNMIKKEIQEYTEKYTKELKEKARIEYKNK